jgi:hypothetical protein
VTQTIETTVDIDATIHKVWYALSHLEQFKSWNSATWFNLKPIVGKKQTMHVKLLGLWLAVPVKIQHCSLNEGLRWQGGIPFIFTGSHYFKLETLGDEKTRMIQGEDFQGICVPLLLPFLRKALNTLYQGMNRDIKHHCENS